MSASLDKEEVLALMEAIAAVRRDLQAAASYQELAACHERLTNLYVCLEPNKVLAIVNERKVA
jgi:hypothetical protein